MNRIISIPLRISNAYVLQGERGAILIDTGVRGEATHILRAMNTAGISNSAITLIAHTHSHSDHAGSTAELARILGVPTALHSADMEMAARGTNGPVRTRGLTAKIMLPFVDLPFERYRPDVILHEGFSLAPYGVEGYVLHTPGHTPGSVTFVNAAGAVAGDVLMGGYLGGYVLPGTPGYHYFVESIEATDESIRRLAALETGPIYVGHGGPLRAGEIRKQFGY
ncbi:MAG: MBL fold metallo-hydrolase [Chloroflexi bacterium]|nr:MBL fold metallo-hydrolase [Chloroflexota bacterium]